MGYALFTLRKLTLTTRMNNCNYNLLCNTERANVLTNAISTKQLSAAKQLSQANTAAYTTYQNAIAKAEKAYGTDTDEYEAIVLDANASLQLELSEAQLKYTMDNAEIQKLNQQQSLMDLQRQQLQTKLNAFQNELTNVEKAEESAIKNSTPKLG